MINNQKSKKKGFTIVELVIVIAVIAILSAVLIPTFVSLIKKANISADTQLAKQLNTALTMNQATDKKPENMDEVITALYNEGFVLENLNPTTSGYHYGWDKEHNQIVLITDEMEISYKNVKVTDNRDVYVLTGKEKNADELAKEGYSLYLTSNMTDITVSKFINVDTGVCTLGTLSMTAEVAASVELKGTINNVTVSNAQGDVNQYATVDKLTVTAIKNGSYHIYGAVNTSATITSGKLVVENMGYVKTLASSSSTPVVNNGTLDALTDGELETGSVAVGSKPEYIAIGSYADLINFRDQVNNGREFEGITVKLTADIDISGNGWTPIGNGNRDDNAHKYFAGTFDGAGHTISGLTNKGMSLSGVAFYNNKSTPKGYTEVVYGLFGVVKNATITNLKLTNVDIDVVQFNYDGNKVLGDSVGAIAGYAYGDTLTIDNCTVSGSVKAFDCAGGFVGTIRVGAKGATAVAHIVSISNCTNNATVTASRRASGIGSYTTTLNANITITNCVNNGNITSLGDDTNLTPSDDYRYNNDGSVKDNKGPNNSNGYHIVAGILSHQGLNGYTITLTDCTNNGTLSSVDFPGCTVDQSGKV